MKLDKTSAGLGAAAAALVGAAGIGYATLANASAPSPSPSGSTTAPQTPGDAGRHRTAEAELTGDTAAKVKAAVLAKLPGATIDRVSAEDPAEPGSATYEAHATKADGSHVQVLLSSAFAVLSVQDDHGFGGRGGPGGPGGHNEPELTGATAASVRAAVLKALPGATVERMSSEDAAEGTSAAYEAHATKTDGTHVAVLLDKSFTVLKVNTMTGFHGMGGRHGGPWGNAPSGSGSPASTSYSTSA